MKLLNFWGVIIIIVIATLCLTACGYTYKPTKSLATDISREKEDNTFTEDTAFDPVITLTPSSSATTSTASTSKTPVLGDIYYVASDGEDDNDGSISAPFKTFKRGISALNPGDALYIRGGVYTEPLVVDVSGKVGKPISILGYKDEKVVIDMEGRVITGVSLHGDFISFGKIYVRGSHMACIVADGNNQWVWHLIITDCFSSGIQLVGGHIDFFGNQVFGTVLRNKDGEGKSWNSAVKVAVGGHDLIIRENEVYSNWGEGIAVTRGRQVIVKDNVTYDNWASNIYIDNSFDVVVERNFSYCTENAPLTEDGFPANAFSLGEEAYESWGAQLARVTIMNNIGAFCKRGIGSWSPQVPEGGLDTIKIVNNTFWGSLLHGIEIYVNGQEKKARNTLIANNIFQQPDNKHGYISDDTGITLENNFWVGKPPKNFMRLSGRNDLWGNVFMLNEPGYTVDSYRLDARSPAIGSGIYLDFVFSDFFGQVRDTMPDQGAIEFSQ